MGTLDRRRFIGITAAAAGMALLPLGGVALAEEAVSWHGVALGAPATLLLHHPDRARARALLARVEAEIRRLERIFSLHDASSELVRLNRSGMALAPAPELVEVLQLSARIGQLSGGAFDPTVQPLWELYAAHFATPGADPAGPGTAAVAAALGRVGFDRVRFGRERIAFAGEGMALTLNGIAQGYITDRIVMLLRDAGMTHSLVDMGESRAIGPRGDGRPWQVAIADPQGAGGQIGRLAIDNRAVATSSRLGFQFDGAGSFSHLLDPRTGRSPRRYDSVTVVADDAATADALSTAFSLMGEAEIETALAALARVEVHLLPAGGSTLLVKSG